MRAAAEVEEIAAELAALVPPADYELPMRVEVFTATRR